MLNGLAMNGSTLPRDAAISTTVATSPYDVSRGGFSGGQVSTRSQSGGNYIVRTMSFTGITPQMQWSDRAAQSLALESTNASVSGRVSGPIKLNRAFYNLSFQYDDNHRDLRTLLDIDALGLQAVGISQDSVLRLREALLETGLPYSVSGFPSANKNQRGSAPRLVRLHAELVAGPLVEPHGEWQLGTHVAHGFQHLGRARARRPLEQLGELGAIATHGVSASR
jgi:hypothetical protein